MRTIVVSDLHLGPDHVSPIYAGAGVLPPLIETYSDRPLRVILNGDTFDLLLDDDPLELDPADAARRTRECARSEDGVELMQKLANVLRDGGEVIVRAGNHDLELALAPVQATLAQAIEQLGAPPGRLQFATDDEPLVIEEGGMRVLVTHGEHTDPFNRWTREQLASGDFDFPPGSKLVKEVLNPLKKRLRFVDLLKPDFHGAVLTALAVRPGDVKALLKRETLEILAGALARSFGDAPFPGDGASDPFARHLVDAAFETEEGEELLAFLDGSLDEVAFADGDDARTPSSFRRALDKLGRAALSLYAATHRAVARRAGARFFHETPDEGEWQEAIRLAHKYRADAVIAGHSHARRFGVRDGITYVNTGTWIALLELPGPDEPESAWPSFLAELRADPTLRSSSRTKLIGSACLFDPEDRQEPVRLIGDAGRPPSRWFERGPRD